LLEGSFKLIYKDKPAGRLPDFTDPNYVAQRSTETKHRGEFAVEPDDEAAN
jgi:hypothetical protein